MALWGNRSQFHHISPVDSTNGQQSDTVDSCAKDFSPQKVAMLPCMIKDTVTYGTLLSKGTEFECHMN